MSPIRVLIADDHPFFRDGLRVLLETTPATEFAGEAKDGHEAIALAAELRPDVILMDLRMPVTGGVEATRRIVAANPDAAVLVVSMVEDDDSVSPPSVLEREATCSRVPTKRRRSQRSEQ